MSFRDNEKPKRIQLKGDGRHEEARAAATITPGMLIQVDSDGNVVPHSTSGGAGERAFALEDALQGRTIDHTYASTELVSYCIADPGNTIYGLLAAGENAAKGSKLSSNGDGTFQVAGGSETVHAISEEALNLSDSGESAAARLRIRVI